MKKDLVVVGAGGFGREVLWQIIENKNEAEKYNILGFVDDNKELAGKLVNDYPVLGDMDWLLKYEKELAVVIAVGNSEVRKILANKLLQNSYLSFPSILASGVKISDKVSYGKGCIFCLNTIATVNIAIGDFFISNFKFNYIKIIIYFYINYYIFLKRKTFHLERPIYHKKKQTSSFLLMTGQVVIVRTHCPRVPEQNEFILYQKHCQ